MGGQFSRIAAWAFPVLPLVASVVLLASGAWVIGVSWDEHWHLQMIGNWANEGWYIRKDEPGSVYVYGPVTSIFSHLLAVTFGAENFGQASVTDFAYSVRHLSIALIGIAGSAGVALLVWGATGSPLFAVIGAASIASFPLWAGHSMFNLKDVPTATGYTLVSAGVMFLASQEKVAKTSSKWAGPVLIALGTVIGVGTRPGMIAPTLATIILGAVGLVVLSRSRADLGVYCRRAGAGLAIGYVVLAAIYPRVFLNMQVLWFSIYDSTAFAWEGWTLTAGEFLTPNPPWYYIPLWYAAKTPVSMQVFAWLGLGVAVLQLWKRVKSGKFRGSESLLIGQLLALSQIVSLPAIAIITNSTLYDGVRQVLFVAPAMSALGTMGLFYLYESKGKLWKAPIVMIASLASLAAIWGQIQVFPYAYTYYNPITSFAGIDGNWPTDYWRTSAREIIPLIPEAEVIACDLWREGLEPELCSGKPQFEPYWADVSSRVRSTYKLSDSEYLYVSVNRGIHVPPPECKPVDELSRVLWGKSMTIGWIAACPVPVSPSTS